MIIYNSMIVWIALMGLLYTCCYGMVQYNQIQYKRREKVPLLMAIITFAYIVFWVGIRSGVADTSTYIYGFTSLKKNIPSFSELWNSDSKAPGFYLFNTVFKTIVSDNYHVWLMAIAIISTIPIMVVIRNRSNRFFYSSFLFIVTLNFYWLMNGIRQFLVVSILFGLSFLIEEKKTIPFIIVVLLLSTVHYTVIIWIPMFFIATGKPFGKKIVFYIGILLLCVAFLNPFIDSMEMVLEETAYSGYTDQFAGDDGVSPLRVLVMAVPVFLAFVGRKQIEEDDDRFINVCVNMSVISFGLYFLAMFTSGVMMGRLPIYFELYNLILIPYLIDRCFTKDSVRLMYVLCTIGYLAFYYLLMVNAFKGYYISDITGLIN